MSVESSQSTPWVHEWIHGKIEDHDSPWHDPDVLQYLYHDRRGSTPQVAEKLGCSQGTVSRWLEKTDIGARDATEVTGRPRVERATFKHTHNGHEVWSAEDPGGTTTVAVHQLLAIADGADPHEVFADDTHVHHRCGVPWVNMEGMVEVVTHGEHARTHTADEWDDGGGIPVLVTQE